MNNFPQKGEINPVFLEWAQQQNASLDHQTCMHCSNPPIGDIPSPKVVLWPVQRASLFALDGDADYPTEPYFNL
ncbi:MAG: hypothetical protein QCH35_09025, partial [Methanomicrobiaceae archaeon]|nr:hypothetical protein [Methanomicrobiaceae archaeon]